MEKFDRTLDDDRVVPNVHRMWPKFLNLETLTSLSPVMDLAKVTANQDPDSEASKFFDPQMHSFAGLFTLESLSVTTPRQKWECGLKRTNR